jgi:hypothetical protein
MLKLTIGIIIFYLMIGNLTAQNENHIELQNNMEIGIGVQKYYMTETQLNHLDMSTYVLVVKRLLIILTQLELTS